MQDKNTTSAYNENIVQEIMGLVAHAMDRAMWAGELILDEDRVHFECRFEEANAARIAIESKLRELVENSFSVREPLSDEQMETLIEKHAPPIHPDFSEDDDFDELVRAVERAHGITKGI